MTGLLWAGFGNSLTGADPQPYDTATFACYGIWTKDGRRTLHHAAVQICTARAAGYVGIQIDSADVSSVNTKPLREADALP